MTDLNAQQEDRIYAEALVWDTHAGFLADSKADLSNLRIWRDARVNYLSVSVGFDLMPWQETILTLASFRRWINAHNTEYYLVSSAGDILTAKTSGKLAIAFDIEGMNALGGRIEMLEVYYHLGVRQMLIAYNRNNSAGGGCHDEDTGLTDFGRAAVREMNRLGMFVDVSHCGYRTSMEVIHYSESPVIFSHSNAKTLCAHERNVNDEQIKACAARGGVIGAAGIGLLLGRRRPRPQLIDHVEYLLDIAGPDHVGIGLDYGFPVLGFDPEQLIRSNPLVWPAAQGYNVESVAAVRPTELVVLARELLRRGHAEATVRGVLGGNFLRLARELWT